MDIEFIQYLNDYQIKIDNLHSDKFWNTIDHSSNKWIYVNDELIEWIGYLKSNGKFKYNHLLKENFKENIDYKVYTYDDLLVIFHSSAEENESHKEILQYKEELKTCHNRTTHLIISPRCFKKTIMMIRTPKANQIRDYFLDMEEVYLETNKILLNVYNSKQSKIDQQNTIMINNIVNAFDRKTVAYIAKIEKDLILFELTNKIINQLTTHIKNFDTFEILYIVECLNNRQLLSSIKTLAEKHNRLLNKTINGITYTNIIKVDHDFTIDMIIKNIQSECSYDYNALLFKFNKLTIDNESQHTLNTNLYTHLYNESKLLKEANQKLESNSNSDENNKHTLNCIKCNKPFTSLVRLANHTKLNKCKPILRITN